LGGGAAQKDTFRYAESIILCLCAYGREKTGLVLRLCVGIKPEAPALYIRLGQDGGAFV